MKGEVRNLKKKTKNIVRIIDPKPIWIVSFRTKSGDIIDKFMPTELAEQYMRAGYPVRLATTAGELQQY